MGFCSNFQRVKRNGNKLHFINIETDSIPKEKYSTPETTLAIMQEECPLSWAPR